MDAPANFVPALELSRLLSSVVEPRLRLILPELPLALAFIGAGSDVLGFDTARSMDHDWGPRLTIVVPDGDLDGVEAQVASGINSILPPEIAGFPTRFSHHEDGTLFADAAGATHRLEITSVQRILRGRLLIENASQVSQAVWLSTPMQTLLELTRGEVFADDSGELTALRTSLAFYPDIVWRYQLAGLWMRMSQIQPFIGRTGEVGDNAGSASITASVARDLMRIALLQSRQYAPYAKWLGSACAQCEIGERILPALTSAAAATDWRERESGINIAGIALVNQLNSLGIIDGISERTEQFHSRPFTILPAERISLALMATLAGTGLDRMQATLGGIDVITDSTDALGSHEFRLAVRAMFAS